eukprot:54263_1
MERNVWKCTCCDLRNPITRWECQACFTSRKRITTALLVGYFRSDETLFNIEIPQSIRIIIMNYIEKRIILAAGRNRYGQLGLKHRDQVTTFTRLHALESLLNKITDIYGNDCMLFIKSNRKIYAAGWNSHYQTGIPSPTYLTTFTEVKELARARVDVISKGISNSNHSFMTTFDGTLYANGTNIFKCFGDALMLRLHEVNTSKWLRPLDCIQSIVCGSQHSIFQTVNLNVYACGDNSCGQCITDETDCVVVPMLVDQNIASVDCGDWFTLLLTKEGIAKCVGDIGNVVYLQNGKKVVDIECGARHCLLLDNRGNVYSLGTDNSCGQRGAKHINQQIYCVDIKESIVEVGCGGDHCVILSKTNNLFVFGYNGFKQCSAIVEDECIFEPLQLNKTKELGQEYVIQKIVCLHNETLLIIDPFA